MLVSLCVSFNFCFYYWAKLVSHHASLEKASIFSEHLWGLKKSWTRGLKTSGDSRTRGIKNSWTQRLVDSTTRGLTEQDQASMSLPRPDWWQNHDHHHSRWWSATINRLGSTPSKWSESKSSTRWYQWMGVMKKRQSSCKKELKQRKPKEKCKWMDVLPRHAFIKCAKNDSRGGEGATDYPVPFPLFDIFHLPSSFAGDVCIYTTLVTIISVPLSRSYLSCEVCVLLELTLKIWRVEICSLLTLCQCSKLSML